jgi:hypothetical protein
MLGEELLQLGCDLAGADRARDPAADTEPGVLVDAYLERVSGANP